MPRQSVLISLLVTMFLIFGSALAQDTSPLPNNPAVNDNANACFEGGSLAGRCSPVDANRDGIFSEAEIEAPWIGGWYYIRFEYGMISRADFPDEYNYLLPPPGTETGMVMGCFAATVSSPVDLEITLPLNTLNNARRWTSTNGSCSGSILESLTIVEAATQSQAQSLCASIASRPNSVLVQNFYPTVSANVWACVNNS